MSSPFYGEEVALALHVPNGAAHIPRLLERYERVGRAVNEKEWRHAAVDVLERRKLAQSLEDGSLPGRPLERQAKRLRNHG